MYQKKQEALQRMERGSQFSASLLPFFGPIFIHPLMFQPSRSPHNARDAGMDKYLDTTCKQKDRFSKPAWIWQTTSSKHLLQKRPLFVDRLLSQWLSEAYFISSQFLLAQIAADKKINLAWNALRTKNYNHQLTRSRRVQKPIIIIDKTAPFEFNSSIILCSKKQRGALSDSHYNSS